MNLGTSKRFVVLVDKLFNQEGAQSAIIMGPPEFRKINLPVEYSGDTNLVTSMVTGAIWMTVTCNQVASLAPSYAVYSRVRYTDS
jgi:hypothetical protein